MANLEIAQIQNAALKAAALEVDESGKKDGYIDSSEINLFTEKAIALLNEKKCTAQEFATLFATNEIDKINITDVFAKVDSLHNNKNTPEALAKEAEEAKQAEKQEKIKEIKAEIAENDKKLKLYEKRLAQKDISWSDYTSEIKPWLKKVALFGSAGGIFTAGFAGLITFMTGSMIAAGIGFAGGGIALASLALATVMKYKNDKESSPKEQEKFRNAYKEAYLKVSQENEQLKAQLAELQK